MNTNKTFELMMTAIEGEIDSMIDRLIEMGHCPSDIALGMLYQGGFLYEAASNTEEATKILADVGNCLRGTAETPTEKHGPLKPEDMHLRGMQIYALLCALGLISDDGTGTASWKADGLIRQAIKAGRMKKPARGNYAIDWTYFQGLSRRNSAWSRCSAPAPLISHGFVGFPGRDEV